MFATSSSCRCAAIGAPWSMVGSVQGLCKFNAQVVQSASSVNNNNNDNCCSNVFFKRFHFQVPVVRSLSVLFITSSVPCWQKASARGSEQYCTHL